MVDAVPVNLARLFLSVEKNGRPCVGPLTCVYERITSRLGTWEKVRERSFASIQFRCLLHL